MARTQQRQVRRTRGRRASDRRPSMEAMLVAGGILAWTWCAYEVLRLVLH